ncbi:MULTISPECIES: hypothetical protein [Bacillaceae]|uniref:hypothetical protein n=1 Tax=Bacillaceae TaxID=186817 RepID=UPI000C772AD1|nr:MULTISPECIES: hypothetical protein [Bacillus]MDT0160847.1 hypothetical protein [Bacillus sp. AG4(2022)]MDW2878312.1 hypothetical protein [Bacillus infantis]PLR70650.1 hypothetical protein CYJ37_21740 [Bacillus sp. UMB0728]
MSARFVQAFVLAAFCFIPSTALADGLLGSATEKVTSTVKETVPLQRSEKSQDQSGQQNNDKAKPKDASLLGTVTGAVEETVKTVTKPIITVEKDENAEEKSLVNINLSEDPSIKVDAKITEASVSDSISVKTPVADAEVGDSIKVKTPVADVDVSDSISVKTPVVNAEVGDSIKVNTPVADVDVSDSISVKTPVVDAEVGDSIKVKTPVADVDVSDSISVKTPVVDAEVGDSIKVNTPAADVDVSDSISVKTPAADIGAGDSTKVNTPSADNGRTDSISITTPADTNVPDGMTAADTPANQTEPDSVNDKTPVKSDGVLTDGLSQPEPLAADASEQFFGSSAETGTAPSAESGNKFQNKATDKAPAEKPVQAAIAYVPANSGTNGTSTTASGGQSASSGAALPSIYFAGVPMIDAMSEKAARYSAVAFFHDQWLNAPPSQPPQTTFFLHVFI